MRIPSGKTDIYLYFRAESTTGGPKTGLSSFTVQRSRNGAAEVAYTTPTTTEIDATTMPGTYALLIDEDTTIASTSDSEMMALYITATGMIPVWETIELYRLPVTSGQTLTVTSGGVTLADGVSHGGTLGSSTATLALSRQSIVSQSANTAALTITGNGSGSGINSTGGTTGHGAVLTGGGTSGDGLRTTATAGNSSGLNAIGVGSGHGLRAAGGTGVGSGIHCLGASNGDGFSSTGNGDGAGIAAHGGVGGTGPGMIVAGDGTGAGMQMLGGTNAMGWDVQGNGSGHGMFIKGGATGHGAFYQGGSTSGDALLCYIPVGGNGTALDANNAGTGSALRAYNVSGGAAVDIYASTSGDGLSIYTENGTGMLVDATVGTPLNADMVTQIQSGLSTAAAVNDLPTNAELATALGTADDAILAAISTLDGKFTFTVAGQVDSNIQYVNDVQVTGNGQTGTEWGP